MVDSVTLTVHREVSTAVEPSRRVCEVASMFGLGVDERRRMTIVPRTELTLRRGQVVFITGASGGGKTTLLKLIRQACEARGDVRLIDLDDLDARGGESCGEQRPLVDSLGETLEQAVRGLSLAGLNDAFVMLRKPGELSDGQRYRWRLARAMAAAEDSPGGADGRLTVATCDEFGSALDRLTARIIARNVRKWTERIGVCFVAATAHDDVLEDLRPDVLIVQKPGEPMQVMEREG